MRKFLDFRFDRFPQCNDFIYV